MKKKRRTRVPPTRRSPIESGAIPRCETCVEKFEQAHRPALDPLSVRAARAILEGHSRLPYGPKVRVRVDGHLVWACPRCDSVSSDENGPRPIMSDLPTRRARLKGVESGSRLSG
jgi:hypothetical protein